MTAFERQQWENNFREGVIFAAAICEDAGPFGEAIAEEILRAMEELIGEDDE